MSYSHQTETPPLERNFAQQHVYMQEAADAYAAWVVEDGATEPPRTRLVRQYPEMEPITAARGMLAGALEGDPRLARQLNIYDRSIDILIRRSESLGAVVEAVEDAFADFYKHKREQESGQHIPQQSDQSLRQLAEASRLADRLRTLPQPESSAALDSTILAAVRQDMQAGQGRQTDHPANDGEALPGKSDARHDDRSKERRDDLEEDKPPAPQPGRTPVMVAVALYRQAEDMLGTPDLAPEKRTEITVAMRNLRQAAGDNFEREYHYQSEVDAAGMAADEQQSQLAR